MMPATEANPRGYWEAEPISELNDELLRELGGWWRIVPPLPDGWHEEPALDPFRERARELVDELFAGAEVAGFKDPRTSLLLPFWRTVVDVAATVLTLRAPAEVAGSLHRRDELHPEESASLWIDYTTAAWLNDPGCHVVTFAALLDDPVGGARAMARAVGLDEPDEQRTAEIAEFRDPALQRSAGFDAGDGPQVRAADALYELLAGDVPDLVRPLIVQLVADRNEARMARQRASELEGSEERALRYITDLAGSRVDAEIWRERAETYASSAERWRDEFDRLRNRKAVRYALKIAGAMPGGSGGGEGEGS
jgi:hypothetical protein